jgi:hypothetical protein
MAPCSAAKYLLSDAFRQNMAPLLHAAAFHAKSCSLP